MAKSGRALGTSLLVSHRKSHEHSWGFSAGDRTGYAQSSPAGHGSYQVGQLHGVLLLKMSLAFCKLLMVNLSSVLSATLRVLEHLSVQKRRGQKIVWSWVDHRSPYLFPRWRPYKEDIIIQLLFQVNQCVKMYQVWTSISIISSSIASVHSACGQTKLVPIVVRSNIPLYNPKTTYLSYLVVL